MGLFIAGDCIDEGRLTGAGAAEDQHHAARLDAELDILQEQTPLEEAADGAVIDVDLEIVVPEGRVVVREVVAGEIKDGVADVDDVVRREDHDALDPLLIDIDAALGLHILHLPVTINVADQRMVLVRLLRAARLRRREVPADMAIDMVDRLFLPERQLLPDELTVEAKQEHEDQLLACLLDADDVAILKQTILPLRQRDAIDARRVGVRQILVVPLAEIVGEPALRMCEEGILERDLGLVSTAEQPSAPDRQALLHLKLNRFAADSDRDKLCRLHEIP